MVAVAALAALAGVPAGASAQPQAPAWKLEVVPTPSTFVPGAEDAGGLPAFTLLATNVGGGPASGPVSVTTTVPEGLDPGLEPPVGFTRDRDGGTPLSCTTALRAVSCARVVQVPPGGTVEVAVPVRVEAASSPSWVTVAGTIEGGGAAAVSVSRTIAVSASAPPFGFEEGSTQPSAAFASGDGATFTQAGGHAPLLTINAALNTVEARSGIRNAGGDLRDLEFELPPGVVVDPMSTGATCTQVELEQGGCPLSSQIGLVQLRAVTPGSGALSAMPTPLFEMDAPPGAAGDFAFELPGAGIFFHLLGEVRVGGREGGYYVFGARSESLPTALGIVGIQVQFWGDPSSESFDLIRGGLGTACRPSTELTPCGVERRSTPQLTLPTSCPAQLSLSAAIDSWQEVGQFVTSEGYFQDPFGAPAGATGCAALEFAPTLRSRPTSAVADSPTGFEAELAIPRQEELETLAQAHLKGIAVTLPQGFSINPSAANGLTSCSAAEVGVDRGTGRPNQAPPSCPDASKIGTLEVESPLLDHPLPGVVYLATPHENPFGSLLAMYAVVADPASGTLIKLPGRVDADEATGQLEARFESLPQLPFSRFKLRLYGGAGAMLRTPARCGRYATASTAAPWSGNLPVRLTDEYEISLPPSGGPCPTTAGLEPGAPSLDAGSASAVAGTYSPLTINLGREDGSQEISRISVTGPPGLSGRLTGIATCSNSELSTAATEGGREEEDSPSCPSGSSIGTVSVALGAGPHPYWAGGRVYLTGRYKGAPIGAAAVVPAVAGPFDLGTVVVRGAISVDPRTAQLGFESDDIPHILDGIPLDVRQVGIHLDRPGLIRNGTSCNQHSIAATAVSVSGRATALSARFQLGKCSALKFNPGFRVSLGGSLARNGHPSLRAVARPSPGEAGIATMSFALPTGELLDLRHLRVLCARGTAADRCPRGSLLGHLSLSSPLFDGPAEGSVYLVEPGHRLPELLAEVHSGDLRFVLHGRAVIRKGRFGISFPAIPDIPLSRAVLSLDGGRRGLFVNSRSLCSGAGEAKVSLVAHSGKRRQLRLRPRLAGC